jgi:hypothetical protein
MKKKVINLLLPENSTLLRILQEAEKEHRAYCNYPCFVTSDIIYVLLRDEGYITSEEWEEFKTEFGNKSFEHLLEAANFVRRKVNVGEDL